MTPTARSLAECRKRGWTAAVVEKFVRFPPPGHRVDLFGCIDIVAIKPAGPSPLCLVGELAPGRIIGIQATSDTASGNSYQRRNKILAEPRMKAWIEANGQLLLWSWSKRGAKGVRKLWKLREETIRIEDFK